jgi:hypothetical protein
MLCARMRRSLLVPIAVALTAALISSPDSSDAQPRKARAGQRAEKGKEAVGERASAPEGPEDPKKKKAEASKGEGRGAQVRVAEQQAGQRGPEVVGVEQAGDAGVKTYRFGAVEVEGRLKSPQVVYFLRRVRAEFEAGLLGHRSFMPELKDTRRDSALR